MRPPRELVGPEPPFAHPQVDAAPVHPQANTSPSQPQPPGCSGHSAHGTYKPLNGKDALSVNFEEIRAHGFDPDILCNQHETRTCAVGTNTSHPTPTRRTPHYPLPVSTSRSHVLKQQGKNQHQHQFPRKPQALRFQPPPTHQCRTGTKLALRHCPGPRLRSSQKHLPPSPGAGGHHAYAETLSHFWHHWTPTSPWHGCMHRNHLITTRASWPLSKRSG